MNAKAARIILYQLCKKIVYTVFNDSYETKWGIG
jgi:hypothetical protein